MFQGTSNQRVGKEPHRRFFGGWRGQFGGLSPGRSALLLRDRGRALGFPKLFQCRLQIHRRVYVVLK